MRVKGSARVFIHFQPAQGQRAKGKDRVTYRNVTGVKRPLIEDLTAAGGFPESIFGLTTGCGIVALQGLAQGLDLHAAGLGQLCSGLALAWFAQHQHQGRQALEPPVPAKQRLANGLSPQPGIKH
ncbi:hypothetical protein D3C72_1696990 [compost metagenome]